MTTYFANSRTKILSFVDPGMRSACPFREVGTERWAAGPHDLAHMLQDVAGALLPSVARPLTWWRTRRLAEAMVEAFVLPIGPEELKRRALKELLDCTQQHLARTHSRTRSAIGFYRAVQCWTGTRRIENMIANVERRVGLRRRFFYGTPRLSKLRE